jgi:hypothetical protein
MLAFPNVAEWSTVTSRSVLLPAPREDTIPEWKGFPITLLPGPGESWLDALQRAVPPGPNGPWTRARGRS